jgi:hypothetical protein
MNGFLDGVSVDSVSLYESELFSFTNDSIFEFILSVHLKYELNKDILNFVLHYFQQYFISSF